MKKKILNISLLVFFAYCSQAQLPDYRVVFDITSKDSTSQQAVVRQVSLIKQANPDAKLEVVVYGQALDLVVNKSAQEDQIQKLLAMKDISFKVCAVTMERRKLDKSQLMKGVEVVPDGIYEIITKEKEGWGYIKVAN